MLCGSNSANNIEKRRESGEDLRMISLALITVNNICASHFSVYLSHFEKTPRLTGALPSS